MLVNNRRRDTRVTGPEVVTSWIQACEAIWIREMLIVPASFRLQKSDRVSQILYNGGQHNWIILRKEFNPSNDVFIAMRETRKGIEFIFGSSNQADKNIPGLQLEGIKQEE